jgi:hypothetical protein
LKAARRGEVEISIQIDNRKNIRWHVVKGVIDVRDLAEYLKGIYASSDTNSEMNSFWDLQNADFSSVTSDDVRVFMGYVGNIWGKGGNSKAALVVSNDLDFGLSRMFQIMMEGATSSAIEVFKDIDAAKQWIEADRQTEENGK